MVSGSHHSDTPLSPPPPLSPLLGLPQSQVPLFPMSCSVQCPTKPHCPVQSLPPSPLIPPPRVPCPIQTFSPPQCPLPPTMGLSLSSHVCSAIPLSPTPHSSLLATLIPPPPPTVCHPLFPTPLSPPSPLVPPSLRLLQSLPTHSFPLPLCASPRPLSSATPHSVLPPLRSCHPQSLPSQLAHLNPMLPSVHLLYSLSSLHLSPCPLPPPTPIHQFMPKCSQSFSVSHGIAIVVSHRAVCEVEVCCGQVFWDRVTVCPTVCVSGTGGLGNTHLGILE